ncbi:alpha/beta hydrolase [Alcanivorax sp. 24]|uniref:alpha/beta hydrolase n=1 Tax=Alcanivorax sp. 24 TaxID=2545266 RepID=UPI00106018C3|nr:alpha/beta hydrolase-fold protein [Alcanivorax sp. 24]
MDLQRRRLSQGLLAAAGLLVLPGPAAARPDMTRTMGTTVADTGLAGYRFESRVFAGAEGRRRHRVWLAIPDRTPPPAGFPALYLLDGNAVLSRLRPEWLTALDEATPPVLVMIGYDTDLLFDGEARHYDYTPAPEGQASVRDARRPQREGGGAAAFIERIESTITPWVASRTQVDANRKALWGHSFGGLFTLFTLCTRPQAFGIYMPVSPSLGWADNLLRQSLDHLAARPPERNIPVWLCRGDNEVRVTAEMNADQLRQRKQQGNAAFNHFADDLDRIPRVEAHRRLYPGLGHGDTFSAALPEALRIVAGLAPDPAWS